MARVREGCDCGCNDPVARTPEKMLRFLKNRLEMAGVAEPVADIYAHDIGLILDEYYDTPKEQILYAVEYTDCIYESGYSVVSLHRTEEGANKAFEEGKAKKLAEWIELGHEGPPDWELWRIRNVEVLK